ncbi:MAG: sigma-70 family RNA polymerase sigma factor [Pseudomonadota bacterium]
MDDTTLLNKVARGDRSAFQQLYYRTSGRLLAIAITMLGSRTLAEDLLQDAFVKIWYSADNFDAARGEPLAWMITITRNLAIDRLRQNRLVSNTEDFEASHLPTLKDENQRLADCLQSLESPQRQSIFAAFFQGLTHQEIAARFAEPIGTIKSRVRRGLAALKGCMEG